MINHVLRRVRGIRDHDRLLNWSGACAEYGDDSDKQECDCESHVGCSVMIVVIGDTLEYAVIKEETLKTTGGWLEVVSGQ